LNALAPAGQGSSGVRPLRVLLVNMGHPELMRGGAQQACYELFLGLAARPDVEAFLLAGTDPAKYPALYKSGACITGFEGRRNEFIYLSRDYDSFWCRTTSPQHIAAFAELLKTLRPHVVHFHHFMRLGIDLLTVTRAELPDCRIVFTFHEFMTICAARGHMVRWVDGSLCTQPSSVRCHQCIPERSPGQFLMRRMWFLRHLRVVDRYVCPSRFQIEQHAAWGIDPGKIFHIPNGQRNYARANPVPPSNGPKNRFGFFGQLIDAKGVHIILRAAQILRSQGFNRFTIELNGNNLAVATPQIRQEFEAFLKEEEQRRPSERNVYNNGSYQAEQIGERMLRIDWSLVPSIWREIFGMVISEAWMFKRPVICSNVGAMAERVAHEVNGLHFQVGDPRALAAVMHRAAAETGLWERLSGATPEPPTQEEVVKSHLSLYAEN
jgi:glycosyltransferase involved in cell wall biosynthesis